MSGGDGVVSDRALVTCRAGKFAFQCLVIFKFFYVFRVLSCGWLRVVASIRKFFTNKDKICWIAVLHPSVVYGKARLERRVF